VSIGGFGGGEVNTAMVFVSLVPRPERELSQTEMMRIAREQFRGRNDLKVFVQDLSTRGFTATRGFPVEINIRGPEWEVLNEKSREIVERLGETGLAVDIDTDYRLGQPEVRVWPLRDEAARR